MKKKKLPLVCWDSIKLLTALFLLWGVCFGADAYPGSEYRKQLGIKEQMNTITNRYNKWLYLFHISSC